MEEEAPSRRSVAELAGRFKTSACPHDADGNQMQEKPVRRRPPRSLQLPKTTGDDQEPPGVTSPLPAKAKRNSALIEKLQANLALSPTALLPSPKSPGFRLLPPAFTPPTSPPATIASPSLAPASLFTEEERPTSFEAPPTLEEGSILSNSSIKGRARHSIRRRPPSRHHRTSSIGDDVGDVSLGATTTTTGTSTSTSTTTSTSTSTTTSMSTSTSTTQPEDQTTSGEKEGGGDVFRKEEETCTEKTQAQGEEEEKGDRPSSGRNEEEEEKGDGPSSGRNEEEEEKSSLEGATNSDSRGAESKETAGQRS